MAKYLQIDDDGILTEVQPTAIGGSASYAEQMVQLDASGNLDESMMPTGISAHTVTVTATEGLSAGDIINLYDNSGTASARKADGGTNQYPAHGYVKSTVTSGASATVYFNGSNAGSFDASAVGSSVFLSDTPGGETITPLTTSGYLHQKIGIVESITSYAFRPESAIKLV
jgi:hypothetical protein